jgi:hypothetical protein
MEMPYMISDVISEAVAELDRYLNDPIWDDVYCGKLRERIVRLRNEAEYLRGLLDVPPGVQLARLIRRVGGWQANRLAGAGKARAAEASVSPRDLVFG